jgi:hypothetical protein
VVDRRVFCYQKVLASCLPRRIILPMALRGFLPSVVGDARSRKGSTKGRPAAIDAARVRELKARGLGATDIAKALKIGGASVHRLLDASP